MQPSEIGQFSISNENSWKIHIISEINRHLNSFVLLNWCRKYSYCHPNGFFKIPLNSYLDKMQSLRIHVWEGMEGSAGDIHNHRWNLTSRIITGSYRHETFSETLSNELDYRKMQYTRITENSYQLTFSGITALQLKNVDTIRAQDKINLSHAVLHRVIPLNNFVASAFIAEGYFSKSCDVILPRLKTDNISNKNQVIKLECSRISQVKLVNLLEKVLACLE